MEEAKGDVMDGARRMLVECMLDVFYGDAEESR
jgi:hypothetical protein